jgi:hypothetical protein
MVHGKCNCGKRATSEWLIQNYGTVWTMKYCDKCEPKRESKELTKIDWNNGRKTTTHT